TNAAHERQLKEFEFFAKAEQGVFQDTDGSVLLADSDRVAFGRAHHDAFDDSLASHENLIVARTEGPRCSGKEEMFCMFQSQCAMPQEVFLYFLWNRSTRPAVSTSFCVLVKKGWHFEQISRWISGFVDRVLKVSPQAHLTIDST